MDIKVPQKLINGVKKKPHANPTNWQFASIKACSSQSVLTLPMKANLKSKFPPVYDQIYGNCTSNAVLGCDAYYYHSTSKTWIPSTTFTYYNQRKMDKAGFDEDDGSYVETGLDAVRKYGVCNSKIWANNQPFDKKPSKAAYEDGLKGHEVTKYYNVTSLTQLKKALASGYPIAASMTWAFSSLDGKYLLNDPSSKEIKKCELGHAIVIVGYDDTTKTVEIRNSWGSNWGNNGYAYISYTTLKKIIWWDDTYAVVK